MVTSCRDSHPEREGSTNPKTGGGADKVVSVVGRCSKSDNFPLTREWTPEPSRWHYGCFDMSAGKEETGHSCSTAEGRGAALVTLLPYENSSIHPAIIDHRLPSAGPPNLHVFGMWERPRPRNQIQPLTPRGTKSFSPVVKSFTYAATPFKTKRLSRNTNHQSGLSSLATKMSQGGQVEIRHQQDTPDVKQQGHSF